MNNFPKQTQNKDIFVNSHAFVILVISKSKINADNHGYNTKSGFVIHVRLCPFGEINKHNFCEVLILV